MPTLPEVIDMIQDIADPRALVSWKKMGVTHSQYLGAGITALRGLAKKVKKNHELALELWATGIHDAKLLATMIEEPKKVTPEQVDAQIAQIYSWDLADKFAAGVVGPTPFSRPKSEQWRKSPREMERRCGWVLVRGLADTPEEFEPGYFEALLAQIEREIHTEANWVREAMLYTIYRIGTISPEMHEKALQTALRIGEVKVDYGNTSCQAPNPVKLLSGSPKTGPSCKTSGC